jgi:ribosomal RNA-processing protein 12
MDDALAKIRPHSSSSLPHQKTPATLLAAVESTLKQHKSDPTPTAYFAALLTTLDASIQKQDTTLGEGDMLPAELYLLAFISPFVPLPVIRSNLNTILSLTSPLFPALTQHAPALRSQLSLYHVLFKSLEKSQLETNGIRQSFASILQLAADPRPKVRRKAADLVSDLLASPPPPALVHPYADRVSTWIIAALQNASQSPLARGKNQTGDGAEHAIHVLALLRPVLKHLPPSVSSKKSSLSTLF